MTLPRFGSPHDADGPALRGGEAGGAFDALVRAHYERLCNFAFRLVGSYEAAEDIVHDVFLQIWRQRGEFEYREPLAYLYRAVRNRAAGLRRHEAVRARVLGTLGLAEPFATSDSAADQEAHDLADAVARAVDSLPKRCRLIFTMSREQNLTYAEIAAALDLSIKTVEAQMSRAFKLLRARLSDHLLLAATVAAAIGGSFG